MRSRLEDYGVYCSLSFFIFYPYLKIYTDPLNRTDIGWGGPYLLLLTSVVLLVGLIFFAAETALKMIAGKRMAEYIFLALVLFLEWPDSLRWNFLPLFIVKLLLSPHVRPLTWLLFSPRSLNFILRYINYYFVAFFVIMTFLRRTKFHRFVRQIYLILLPSMLVFIIYGLTYPALSASKDFSPKKSHSTAGPIRLFIIFDEWSFDRTFVRDWEQEFPGIKALAKESIFFPQAISPGAYTRASIPALLGQPRYEYSEFERRLTQGESVNDFMGANVFADAKQNGYSTHLLGFELPYGLWLKDSLDSYRVWPFARMAGGKLGFQIINEIWKGWEPLVKEWDASVPPKVDMIFGEKIYLHLCEQVFAQTKLLISQSDRSFVMIHYPRTHPPLNCGRDRDIDYYLSNLNHMDQELYDLIKILKQKGRWDSALVVATADHGWRTDPLYTPIINDQELLKLKRHVPLLIKLPYQSSPQVVRDRFETKNIPDLLGAVFRVKATDFNSFQVAVIKVINAKRRSD